MENGEEKTFNGVKSVREDENTHVTEENQKCTENALAASKDKLKDDEATKSEEVVLKANDASALQNQKSSGVEEAEKATDDILIDESKSGAATEGKDNSITEEQDTPTAYTVEEVDSTVIETQEQEIYTTGCGEYNSVTISSITSSITIMPRSSESKSETGSSGQTN